MGIPYHVISTGSNGNAVVLASQVLVDCGVSYKSIEPFVPTLRLVLMTHVHSDHLRSSTVRRLASERPSIRWACGPWLVKALLDAGVPDRQIDVVNFDHLYRYSCCDIAPVALNHDVSNCGWKIFFPFGKVFYATDTNDLNGISAPDFDLYMIEANYVDEDIQEKIAEKKVSGEYVYELRVLQNHLSKAKCDNFIYRNIGPGGEYVYLHCHMEEP